MSWPQIRFGDLYVTDSRNGVSKPSRVRGTGYKMINMGELFSNDRIYDIPMELVPLSEREKASFKVEPMDLLFARQSLVLEGAGKCSIVMETSPLTVFESHLIRVRLNSAIANPLFYYYFFLSPYSNIKTIVSQCAQAGIRGSDLSELKVHYPPKETQDKIADILSQYDLLIETNQKQIKLLEEAAQYKYFEYLHSDNVKWGSGVLSDIAIDSGKNEKKKNREEYSYYLPIDCLPQKSLTYYTTNDISMAESSLVAFKEDDVLFGAMRPYFHKVVIAKDRGLTRSTCFVINAKNHEYWGYLVMLLFSEKTVNWATQNSVGTTMPYVRWKDFSGMPIQIPDEDSASRFNDSVRPLFDEIKTLSKQLVSVQRARDIVLPLLLSGDYL